MALLPIIFYQLRDRYLSKHLIPSYSLGDFTYGHSFAAWLGNIRDHQFAADSFGKKLYGIWDSFLTGIYDIPRRILQGIVSEDPREIVLVGFALLFWLMAFNALYLLCMHVKEKQK